MPREPQVVDVEGSSRSATVRHVLVLLLLAVIATGIWVALRRMQAVPPLPASADAAGVRSTVTRAGDSLQVAVTWELRMDSLRAPPESIRIEVGLSASQQLTVATESAERKSDTLMLPVPAPGQTASGYSCVAPIHRGQIRRESCTPWQFVRPAADTAPATGAASDTAGRLRRRTAASASSVRRIVVQPAGLQVDPDPEGRCAHWQREHPERSVWIEVNQQAVPECTGANGKPMVAQFCAFAELVDGRRVMTSNSSKVLYCDRLFRVWAGERVS